MAATREETIGLLQQAYCMELETVMNYLANGINLDGVRAEEIKKSLLADVQVKSVTPNHLLIASSNWADSCQARHR